MCKTLSFFLSIVLLFSVEHSMHAVLFKILTVDRAPSASTDMRDFFDSIDSILASAEKDSRPDEVFCIDYNTILIRLFSRLDHANPIEKAKWLQGFREHSTKLAHHRRVKGLKLVYRALADLPLTVSIIEPLVEKLQSLQLTPIFQDSCVR